MNTQELLLISLGGYQTKLCTGTNEITLASVNMAGRCVALLPNPGCIFTSIKRDDDETINYADATHGNYLTVDLGTDRKPIPIIVKDPNSWSKITMSAGDCYAIYI